MVADCSKQIWGFGDLGRMVIYIQGAGELGNYFHGSGEQVYSFEDLGSPAKK